MRYIYCPICGKKLTGKQAGDDGTVPFCDTCSRYWFDTFASCVIILVVNEHHEIALLRQGYLSQQYETFVSGFIKPGETAEETAMREVQEELGIQLERLEYGGTHWFGKQEQLMHAFIGFAKKQEFSLSSEVDYAQWVPYQDATARMFPDRPGNTQHILYRLYLRKVGLDI